MADPIYLVRGDNRPYITLTLVDDTGAVLDLSNPLATVSLHWQAEAGGDVTTFSLAKVGDGTEGKVRFNFPGSSLNVEPGWYVGEVEVAFDAERQTVYEKLKFYVRDDIA